MELTRWNVGSEGFQEMKILYSNEKIIALCGDEYQGPDLSIEAPDGFGVEHMDKYAVVDGSLVPEFDQFTELKTAKLQSVQAEKVRARDAGFLVGDTLFDSDISARTSYTEQGLRLAQNPSFTTRWKASSGQWVTMDAALYEQVVIAGESHITAVFAWQAAKEEEIRACESVEELEAVKVTL